NKWQEMKHRQLAEKLLNPQPPDILLDSSAAANPADDALRQNEVSHTSDERVEPLLRTASADDAPHTASRQAFDSEDHVVADTGRHDADEDMSPTADDVPARQEIQALLPVLSPTIDHIAAIELSQAVGGHRLRQNQRLALTRIAKPIHWLGYNEDVQTWENIDPDSETHYRHLRVGLQLVDRKGPVRDSDLSIFHVAMQDLASELLGLVDLPPSAQALRQAAELDEFCVRVDIQIGINVISQGQIFPGTKLRALAESAGMSLDGEGRFVRLDDDANVLYVLVNQQSEGFTSEAMRTLSTHGVTFLLDVPRVIAGERVLKQMLDTAQRFADALRGVVVDDNRRPLAEGAMEPICRQVAQFQALMAEQQLPAGSKLSQRLFA
ncbi:MAG TPA: cell division protein ZipA C-terminal FtsZ-binding domain-containing protein, partial [Accumulibacter sp.]|nr:cell division protein ZipA C-terminal FtsZ-binding domain-containing protein [Accumulibacter sp.]